MDELKGIIDFLKELDEDSTVPRNVRVRIELILNILEGEGETNMKINRAIDELDEVCNDGNLQVYTRTQLWNVVSMLENI